MNRGDKLRQPTPSSSQNFFFTAFGITKLLALVVFVSTTTCQGFKQYTWGNNRIKTLQPSPSYRAPLKSTAFRVATTQPPEERSKKSWQVPQQQRRNVKSDAVTRWRRAEHVEKSMVAALERMQQVLADKPLLPSTAPPVLFPSVRDCNAALATFGDGGEFLRALKLFVKMRKSASLAQKCRVQNHFLWHVPAPTLVTYSTLMSRAVQVGKARVALRLWNLMRLQAEFFSSPQHQSLSSSSSKTMMTIVPDVKAANILMNAHAKLADVESAQDLMRQMRFGNGTDVPLTTPNLVTYNTLLDACHKAGELDAALRAKQQLDESGVIPDARTYTSLIATVARKASTASGAHDPSLAFTFLQEMMSRNIRPNGMTYTALIDACGRCRRSDLALQGLRSMLRQKAKEQKEWEKQQNENDDGTKNGGAEYQFPNEVGAWTAAIDACGKSGRMETALKLFYSMPNFGVQPNTVTCGSLTDCLLRSGRTADTLNVLRYMKREGIAPSEVMYTSLMSSAGRLVQSENKKQTALDEDALQNGASNTTAIEVYTELMKSLIQDSASPKLYGGGGFSSFARPSKLGSRSQTQDDANTLLVKVFLVFQEMKAVGAQPDLACYNALLRACARAGDFTRAQDVLTRIQEDGLCPSDTSWREMIKAAGKARRSDLAEATWIMALHYRGDEDHPPVPWRPSVESFGTLVSAYVRHASSLKTGEAKRHLYEKVIDMYKDVQTGTDTSRGLNLIPLEQLNENPRVLLLILQAIVALTEMTGKADAQQSLRALGRSIATLECLTETLLTSLKDNHAASRALQVSRTWI